MVGKSCRVFEVAELGFVIPDAAGTGDALIVALVKNHAAFGNDLVFRLVDGYLVGLHPVDAVVSVDIAFVNDNAFALGFAFDGLVFRVNDELAVAAFGLRRRFGLRLCYRYGLRRRDRVNVRRVGDRIRDLSVDRISLLSRADTESRHAASKGIIKLACRILYVAELLVRTRELFKIDANMNAIKP